MQHVIACRESRAGRRRKYCRRQYNGIVLTRAANARQIEMVAMSCQPAAADEKKLPVLAVASLAEQVRQFGSSRPVATIQVAVKAVVGRAAGDSDLRLMGFPGQGGPREREELKGSPASHGAKMQADRQGRLSGRGEAVEPNYLRRSHVDARHGHRHGGIGRDRPRQVADEVDGLQRPLWQRDVA